MSVDKAAVERRAYVVARSSWIPGLVAALCLSIGACSSGSDAGPGQAVFTADDLSCDHDMRSLTAKDTIERVGGLVDDDFTVRFAKSTRLGIVALVDGDTEQAFATLHGTYGVALVATIERADDPGRVVSFAQVRTLVAEACGDDSRAGPVGEEGLEPPTFRV